MTLQILEAVKDYIVACKQYLLRMVGPFFLPFLVFHSCYIHCYSKNIARKIRGEIELRNHGLVYVM